MRFILYILITIVFFTSCRSSFTKRHYTPGIYIEKTSHQLVSDKKKVMIKRDGIFINYRNLNLDTSFVNKDEIFFNESKSYPVNDNFLNYLRIKESNIIKSIYFVSGFKKLDKRKYSISKSNGNPEEALWAPPRFMIVLLGIITILFLLYLASDFSPVILTILVVVVLLSILVALIYLIKGIKDFLKRKDNKVIDLN